MLCTHCNQNEASFHYRQVNNGQAKELHLCADCARELGYLDAGSDPFNFNSLINQFFGGISAAKPQTGTLSCDQCGLSYGEFRNTGLLGCPHCYEVFADAMEAMLEGIQPGTTHKGKIAGQNGEEAKRRQTVKALKEQLQKAILEERYEQAASLRDQIRAIEAKPQDGGDING